MKKTFKWVALGLCALSLMASCKKKSSGEPIGGGIGTGTGQPVDQTKGIKLTLAAGETTFSLSRLLGEGITIEGIETNPKSITAWENSKQTFTALKAGATIVIRGNITKITLSEGKFTEVNLSTMSNTLTHFTASDTDGKANNLTIPKLSLENLTNLQYVGLNAIDMTTPLDLTSNTSLLTVVTRALGSNANAPLTIPSTVTTIDIEQTAVTKDIISSNYPMIETLSLRGNGGLGKVVNLSNSKTLKKVVLFRLGIQTANFSNCPALVDCLVAETTITDNSLNLQGSSALKAGTLEAINKFSGLHIVAPLGFSTINLSGIGLTVFNDTIAEPSDKAQTFEGITNLDLSNNKLTEANFSKFTALKSLNLLNNTTLTGTALTNALNTLPKTSGTIKIANLNESDAAIVTSKGWTIVAN